MSKPSSAQNKTPAVFVVVVLLLTLVGAGTGFAVGSLIQSAMVPAASGAIDKPAAAHAAAGKSMPNEHGVSESQAPQHADQSSQPALDDEGIAEDIDLHSVKVVPFPPVLTTLAEPKGTWIRLEGSILITPEAIEPPEVLADRAGEQILTYLRSLHLEQLEGTSGVQGLREDLTEMLRVLSKDEVRGILINGLVIE